MSRRSRIVLAVFAVVFASASASAHNRSESYSHWYLGDGGVTAIVTIPLREVMLLYRDGDASIPPRRLFQSHLEENVGVFADGVACSRTASDVLEAATGFVRVELTYSCDGRTVDEIRLRAMYDVVPAHVHYAKLHRGGVALGEKLLTDSADRWSFATLDAVQSASFSSFLRIGVEHIAGGIDHIAFLFGLLLIAGTAGRSVIAVTGFTLGHSLSLAAAVLGYVRAEGQLVEAFIGFTVALVAVEYFLLRRQDVARFAIGALLVSLVTGMVAVLAGLLESRALFAYAGFGIFAACYLVTATRFAARDDRRAAWLLFVATTAFGLVHGFGFAGFLMDTGLLGTSLLLPLLGFNLGVEIGQLVIVGIALTLGLVLGRHLPRVLPQIVAAGLCGIGVFWFVGRTLA